MWSNGNTWHLRLLHKAWRRSRGKSDGPLLTRRSTPCTQSGGIGVTHHQSCSSSCMGQQPSKAIASHLLEGCWWCCMEAASTRDVDGEELQSHVAALTVAEGGTTGLCQHEACVGPRRQS